MHISKDFPNSFSLSLSLLLWVYTGKLNEPRLLLYWFTRIVSSASRLALYRSKTWEEKRRYNIVGVREFEWQCYIASWTENLDRQRKFSILYTALRRKSRYNGTEKEVQNLRGFDNQEVWSTQGQNRIYVRQSSHPLDLSNRNPPWNFLTNEVQTLLTSMNTISYALSCTTRPCKRV